MAGGHTGKGRGRYRTVSERPSMASPASATLERAQQTGKQGVQTETLLDPPAERERDRITEKQVRDYHIH